MISVPLTPYEELNVLVSKLGGQRPVATVLGKQPKLIWSWLKNRPALQRESVKMIHDTFVVVDALSSKKHYEATDLRFLLETDWPSLNQQAPLTLIKQGNLDLILKVVGSEVSDVAIADRENAAWKIEAQEEMEASFLSRTDRIGDPFEDYVFLMQMSDAEVASFAAKAAQVLEQVETPEAWEAFLDGYWSAVQQTPPALAVAVESDEVIADEEMEENRLSLSLSDLLVRDRAMSPRRFSREAVTA